MRVSQIVWVNSRISKNLQVHIYVLLYNKAKKCNLKLQPDIMCLNSGPGLEQILLSQNAPDQNTPISVVLFVEASLSSTGSLQAGTECDEDRVSNTQKMYRPSNKFPFVKLINPELIVHVFILEGALAQTRLFSAKRFKVKSTSF